MRKALIDAELKGHSMKLMDSYREGDPNQILYCTTCGAILVIAGDHAYGRARQFNCRRTT